MNRFVYICIYIYMYLYICKYIYINEIMWIYGMAWHCVCMIMYVCMYVWMDGWMDGCMYVCTYVHMYKCTFVYICIYAYMYICVYAYMYIYICIYLYIFVFICIYLYILYISVYIYTHMLYIDISIYKYIYTWNYVNVWHGLAWHCMCMYVSTMVCFACCSATKPRSAMASARCPPKQSCVTSDTGASPALRPLGTKRSSLWRFRGNGNGIWIQWGFHGDLMVFFYGVEWKCLVIKASGKPTVCHWTWPLK